MRAFLLGTIFLLCLPACAPDAPAPAEEVQEGTNASIIRNPVADGGRATVDPDAAAAMTFGTATYDFGSVRAGSVVRYEFEFTNTGKQPLLITDARSTCGCTVPSYPEAPVPPGESATVTVEFNTTNKRGRQRKPITLTTNTYPATTTLYVEGTVEND